MTSTTRKGPTVTARSRHETRGILIFTRVIKPRDCTCAASGRSGVFQRVEVAVQASLQPLAFQVAEVRIALVAPEEKLAPKRSKGLDRHLPVVGIYGGKGLGHQLEEAGKISHAGQATRAPPRRQWNSSQPSTNLTLQRAVSKRPGSQRERAGT